MKARLTTATVIGVMLAAGGIALVARDRQQTTAIRPGEMTQAHVWVDNRSAAEAVPVVVETLPSPVSVRIDQANVVRTAAAIQNWEYRTVQVAGGWNAGNIGSLGSEGWEAVGMVPSGTGATILFKRPR